MPKLARDPHLRQRVVAVIGLQEDRERLLARIVDASGLLPFLFGARQHPLQHRRQQGNDGNDDQRFNESEGGPRSW